MNWDLQAYCIYRNQASVQNAKQALMAAGIAESHILVDAPAIPPAQSQRSEDPAEIEQQMSEDGFLVIAYCDNPEAVVAAQNAMKKSQGESIASGGKLAR